MDLTRRSRKDRASSRFAYPVRTAILDCLGTLVELEPPAPRLRRELARRGVDVTPAQAAAAIRAEIGYYLAHHLEGRDPTGLASLRAACARVVGETLGLAPSKRQVVLEALLAALRFRAYPDAAPELGRLRAAGVSLVVASNWDCSLPGTLGGLGLRALVDAVVTSAQVGAAKPHPAVMRAALEAGGAAADGTVAIGDSVEHDVAAAAAAGIPAILLRREGGERSGEAPAGVPVARTLAQARSLVLAPR